MSKRTITEINVDLDGVLVNFPKKALEVAGVIPDHAPENKELRRDFWKAIDRHIKAGNKFFEVMEPLDDAFVLWTYLNTLPVPKVICSATGHLVGAAVEKRAWVRKHLGDETANAARFVRDGHQKAQYASPTTILIDDRRKVITPFIEAGGIGILHTSAESTIAQLKEMFDGV